jgi:mRNA interferase RelE/StbE
MELRFRDSFNRDLRQLTDKKLKEKIGAAINDAGKAANITQLKNLKKLKGHPEAYRIRVGDYRIGIFIEGKNIEFTRCLHRTEIYRFFP